MRSNLGKFRPIFLAIALFLPLCLCLLLRSSSSSSFQVFVNAKEIVATNEWQLLPEGDTIPAGLHVKMDLSTGKKWVKIASNDNDDKKSGQEVEVEAAARGGNSKNSGGSGKKGSNAVEMKANGDVSMVPNK
eukprot:CAMPEP_0183702292 /NCGR_PEP_ID=MMETSP0737-20130205/444_1 /TAXON_ID=385413 /ORGANISM="Thalassiosira miniscula, Strain CCMP1093" /LENGTH=131 /DNA_ID=CAMNT_0025928877 /DNA_START=111 /DNA_END=506 /DNA_ORIENTATION=+